MNPPDVYDGIVLNGVITMTGGVAFLALVPRLLARPATDRTTGALALFFTAVGLHLSLAGLRQLVAYAWLTPEVAARIRLDLVSADFSLFLVTSAVGAVTVLPLAYYACAHAAPGRARLATTVLAFLAIACLGLFLASPMTGPIPSRWGSEWEVASLLPRALLGVAVAAPAGVSIVVLVRRRDRVARTIGLCALVYYAAIVPDAIGLTGVVFIAARIAAASAVLLAYEATRRPFVVPDLSRERLTRSPR